MTYKILIIKGLYAFLTSILIGAVAILPGVFLEFVCVMLISRFHPSALSSDMSDEEWSTGSRPLAIGLFTYAGSALGGIAGFVSGFILSALFSVRSLIRQMKSPAIQES
jgi:hypothetical protein